MRFVRRTILAILAFVILAAALVIFFVVNDAPITQGEVEYDIEYKPGLSLDIYKPINKKFRKNPVVVFIHGGGWVAGRKEAINMNRFHRAIKQLREKGYIVISPDYTLAEPEKSPFPGCIVDMLDVIDWIQDNADKYSFDLDRVGLFGESAGAHIAMMVGYSNGKQFKETHQPLQYDYVVDVYGPSNLRELYRSETIDSLNSTVRELPEAIRERVDLSRMIFGFDPATDTAKANQLMDLYSPINYLSLNAPPTLIIQGDDDFLVPMKQSLDLRDRLVGMGLSHEFHLLSGVDHGFLAAEDEQMDSVQNWIAEFVIRNTME